MKLEKLKTKGVSLTKEAMSATFGGFTVNGTNCAWSYVYAGGPRSDCGDGSFD